MTLTLLLSIIHEFFHLLLTVTPFFILGASVGAGLDTFFTSSRLLEYFKKPKVGVPLATLMAALLPGCACATIPLAEGLKRKGLGMGTVCAFIFSSPLLGPHTMILTAALISWEFTVARTVFTLVMGLVVGLIFTILEKASLMQMPEATEEEKHCCHAKTPSFFQNLKAILKKLVGYYLIGLAVAALLTTVVPQDVLPTYIGDSVWSYLIAALVGIPIYICEGEEVPITAALLGLGLAPGVSFAFMMGAVGTCIPTMIMAQKLIGKPATVVYVLIWIVSVPIAGALVSAAFS